MTRTHHGSKGGLMSAVRSGLRSPRRRGRGWVDWQGPTGFLVAVVLVAVVIISAKFAIKARQDAVARIVPAAIYDELPEAARAGTTWDPQWPALVIGSFPARPIRAVQEAYAFAGHRPDVLQYIPCYCGCGRSGHDSIDQCYLRRRLPNGDPVWSAHSVTCAICIDITRDVAGMIADGMPLSAIRRTIDARYSALPTVSTPTPQPSASSPRRQS